MKIKWPILPITLLAIYGTNSVLVQIPKTNVKNLNEEKLINFTKNYQIFIDSMSEEVDQFVNFDQSYEVINNKIVQLFNTMSNTNTSYFEQYKEIVADKTINFHEKSVFSQNFHSQQLQLNNLLSTLEMHINELSSIDEYEKEDLNSIILNQTQKILKFRKESNDFWKTARDSFLLENEIKKFVTEYSTKHKTLYPQWKVGDEVTVDDLGIEIPKIENKNIKLHYIITNVDNSTGTVAVDVVFSLNQNKQKLQIVVKDFSLVNIEEIKKQIHKFLFKNFTDEFTTQKPHQKIEEWAINSIVTAEQLGINFTNDLELDIKVDFLLTKVDSFTGEVEVEAIAKYFPDDITVIGETKNFKVIGFDNQIDSYKNIINYLKSLDNSTFSVKEKVSTKNSWQDFVNLINDDIEKQAIIDKDLLKDIKWTVKDKNLDEIVEKTLESFNGQTITQQFVVNVHEKIDPIDVNITFQDLLKSIRKEINETKKLESKLGLLSQKESFEYVLKENFSWEMLQKSYKSMVFSNSSLTYNLLPLKEKTEKITKKINIQNLKQGQKIKLAKVGIGVAELIPFMLYANLCVDLKVNDKNQLVLTFTLTIDASSRLPVVEAIAKIGTIEIN